VFGDRDDIGASDFCDGDTSICLVGCVEIDVIGSDTSSDGKLQVLGFRETFGSEVTWVESASVSRVQ
jgi:hypothetical protein